MSNSLRTLPGLAGSRGTADGCTMAELVVDRLVAWGATHAFGMVGDGGWRC